MRGFRFRLDSVLRLRRHELDSELRELAHANVGLANARAALSDAQDQTGRASQRLMERASEGIGAGDFELAEHALVCSQSRVERCGQAAEQAKGEVESARARAGAARTRVRALEIMRERALRTHRQRALEEEQSALDEIGGRLRFRGEPDEGSLPSPTRSAR